jgi:glycosyltransferase involved in cell wall biosynthesis
MNVEKISIILPCHNEVEAIGDLFLEINQVMKNLEPRVKWECIWVDDGSTDLSWQELVKLCSSMEGQHHRALRLRSNLGQTTALMAGIDHSKSDWIVTMDADGQNDPQDILRMVKIVQSSKDVICGHRYSRKDVWFRRTLPSRVANLLARKMFRLNVNDLGCTLRLFNKELLQGMRLQGEMHRTLTIYLKLNGGKLSEIKVNHRARKHGSSKYGSERIFKFLCDLILVRSYSILKKSPLYFFAGVAVVELFITFLLFFTSIIFGILSEEIIFHSVTFLLASIFMMFNIVSIGLIGELILKSHFELTRDAQYSIADDSSLTQK